jgi:hypothetical protein
MYAAHKLSEDAVSRVGVQNKKLISVKPGALAGLQNLDTGLGTMTLSDSNSSRVAVFHNRRAENRKQSQRLADAMLRTLLRSADEVSQYI